MLKINVKGDAVVYRHERNGKVSYSVQFSKSDRKPNGETEWRNVWLYAHFKRGVDIPNKTKIEIEDGWLDFYTTKATIVTANKPKEVTWDKFGIFVSEFDVLGSTEPTYNKPVEDTFTAAEEDIPF